MAVSASGGDIDRLIDHWESLPDVDHAEPNYYRVLHPNVIPNDPLYSCTSGG